jgi:hypothetical protein
MLALEEPPRLAMMQSEQDWCDGPRSWTDPNVQHMDSARGILILSERGASNSGMPPGRVRGIARCNYRVGACVCGDRRRHRSPSLPGLTRQSILLAGSFYEGDGPPEIGFTRFRARANAHAPLIG